MAESATLYTFSLRVTNIYHDSMIDEEGFIIPPDKIGEVAGQKVNGSTTYQGDITLTCWYKGKRKAFSGL
jgi:hypothetical protein